MGQDEQDTQDGAGFALHNLPIPLDARLSSKPTSTAMEQDEQGTQDRVEFILHILPILFDALLLARPM